MLPAVTGVCNERLDCGASLSNSGHESNTSAQLSQRKLYPQEYPQIQPQEYGGIRFAVYFKLYLDADFTV